MITTIILAVSNGYITGGIISLLVFGYLIYALLKPDKFWLKMNGFFLILILFGGMVLLFFLGKLIGHLLKLDKMFEVKDDEN